MLLSEPLVKFYKSTMHLLPSYLAVISPIGQEGILDVCHKGASSWPYSARVLLRTPAGLIFGAVQGQLLHLIVRFLLRKSQLSVRSQSLWRQSLLYSL